MIASTGDSTTSAATAITTSNPRLIAPLPDIGARSRWRSWSDNAHGQRVSASSRLGCSVSAGGPHLSSRRPTSAPSSARLLLDAFDSNWIAPLGPHVDAFEREFAAFVGVRGAAALSSGTAALHLALVLLGVGPGDEVLVPTLTFVATANAVRVRGRAPGVRRQRRAPRGTSTPRSSTRSSPSARAPGALPAAVLGVDLYGQCADWDPILERRAPPRRARDRGRGRGARRDLPRPAGRVVRRASACSRSTATRSSPRAAAACSSRDDPAADRAGPAPRHAGARPGAALRALRASASTTG